MQKFHLHPTSPTEVVLPTPNLLEEALKKVFDLRLDKVVDQTGKQVAHSKAVLAQRVLSNTAPFDQFGVDEFRLIFDVIEVIAAL